MAAVRPLPVVDFTGGLNLITNPFQLGPTESPDLLNVEIDPRGGVRSRDGWQRWSATPISGTWTPKALGRFYVPGGSRYVMMVSGGVVRHSTSGVWSVLSDGANVPATAPHGASFMQWGSTLYMALGRAQTGRKWSGSGNATLLSTSGPTWQDNYASPTGTHMPKADLGAVHASMMFVAATNEGGTDFPNRVRWSHPNSPENWHSADYIDITAGGSRITALVPFGDHLLIFKDESVWALYGYNADTWQLVNITSDLGVASQQCVAHTSTAVWLFSWPTGLLRYDQRGLANVSRALRPALDSGDVVASAVNSGQVWLNAIDGRLWLSLPYSKISTPSKVTRSFVFDPSLGDGAWIAHASADGFGIGAAIEHDMAAGDRLLLAAHPEEPYVLRLQVADTASDAITEATEAFTSYYTTGWLTAEVPTQKKMWRRADVIARRSSLAQVITMKVFKDYDERSPRRQFTLTVDPSGGGSWGSGTWGSGTWGVAGESNEIERARAMGQAKAIQIQMSGTPGIRWWVDALVLKYVPRRFR